MNLFLSMKNVSSVNRAGIPVLDLDSLRSLLKMKLDSGARIASFFGVAEPDDPARLKLFVILAAAHEHELEVTSAWIPADRYPALTPDLPQLHRFERELAEQFGVIPEGHPDLKPLRFQRSWTGRDAWNRKEEKDFEPHLSREFRVEGESIHEVAVGPIHAGVIEPGHFRFQCHGELVYNLEISLGYQHRGIERSMIGGPDNRSIHFMETLAGDSTISHTLNYVQILEALSGIAVPERAESIRTVALELERVANHVGDLGALAGDVAFLPTSSYCGRIRGEYLNMTAQLCGNRFGRGLLVPGGTAYDLEIGKAAKLTAWIEKVFPETKNALNLMFDAPSVLDRLEGTGTVPMNLAAEIGMVGVPARASGLWQDIRSELPHSLYRKYRIHPAKLDAGDVLSRAKVRYREICASVQLINSLLASLPDGPFQTFPLPCAESMHLAPDSLAVSLTEGWRGEICHAALTGHAGKLERYKVVDPSFHNWLGLALALRGEQISNFPICNKSFNLSYCGHDL